MAFFSIFKAFFQIFFYVAEDTNVHQVRLSWGVRLQKGKNTFKRHLQQQSGSMLDAIHRVKWRLTAKLRCVNATQQGQKVQQLVKAAEVREPPHNTSSIKLSKKKKRDTRYVIEVTKASRKKSKIKKKSRDRLPSRRLLSDIMASGGLMGCT